MTTDDSDVCTFVESARASPGGKRGNHETLPIRRAWDLGATLAAWSGGLPDEVSRAAARTLVAGYAEEADVPRPFDLGAFTAAVCAELNWLGSRIRMALTEADEERRGQADRAVPWLLERPPSRARFQTILDAVT